MPNTASAADAALSIDDAVALMNASERSKDDESARAAEPQGANAPNIAGQADATDANTTEHPAANEADGGDHPDEPDDGAAETTEDDAPAAAELSPPPHWNSEERAIFAKASPELKDAILAQEKKREAVLARHKQDAAEARKAAENEKIEIGKRTATLDRILPTAINTFQHRWAEIDWQRLPDEVGADQAFKLKAQFENEREQIGRLLSEQARAEEDRHRQFVKSESENLRTEAPDLIDPKDGRARMAALSSFLVGQGFPPVRLALMSAREAAIAYDAMRWREAQAKARAQQQSQSKPAPAPRVTVKPTAAQSPRSTTTRADDAMKRLAKTGRIDDAVAFLNARNN